MLFEVTPETVSPRFDINCSRALVSGKSETGTQLMNDHRATSTSDFHYSIAIRSLGVTLTR